ncbi:MAG: tetrahydrofolate dehydrogenase/cyclohydrolase catalytic domain-containing protein, partial [Chloroflexota bacterium]
MSAKIISGTQIGAEIREEIAQKVRDLKERGVTPGLSVVLVGEDPASVSYAAGKAKAAQELGIYEETFILPQQTTEAELAALIAKLNADPKFHGILVQLPLPCHISGEKVTYSILPSKDVDAFHPVNVGRLLIGQPSFLPCTPHGIQQLLV